MTGSAVTGLFHVTHGAADVEEMERWFQDVFQRGSTDPGYLPPARRYARFTVIGDLLFESVGPDGQPSAIQTFVSRFGNHLNSLAWGVDHIEEFAVRLHEGGIRLFDMSSQPTDGRDLIQATMFGHPRDTHGMLEFFEPADPDASGLDRWRGAEPDSDPLGVLGLSHVTMVVRELPVALHFWTDLLGAEPLSEGDNALLGSRSAYVIVGTQAPTVVELAQPTRPGIAADDLAACGEVVHMVTLQVEDLTAAADHLRRSGVALTAGDEEMVVCDPASTVGAGLAFTVAPTPAGKRS